MTPLKAIGIVRISKVGGREGDSFASPAIQRQRIAEVCVREGFDLVDVKEEFDVSGGKPLAQRHGLNAAVEAIESGRAAVIVAAYFDRFVRSLKVQAEVLERVEAAGGRVMTADIGEVSHETTAKWVSAQMFGMLAEHHNRLMAEKLGEAQTRALLRGIPPFRLPKGLAKVDGEIVHSEDAAAVREAFVMRVDGATIAEIREYLAGEGVELSYSGVMWLLRSRLLSGRIEFGEHRGRLPGEPVVEADLWERAQAVRVPRGRHGKSERLLARLGVLRCGTCGGRMVVGSRSRNGHVYPFYRCPATGAPDCTARVTVAAEAIEAIVVETVRGMLDGTAAVRTLRENARQARRALEAAQRDLDGAIRVLSVVGDEPAAIERLARLREERDHAQARLAELEPDADGGFVFLDDDWDDLSVEDRRRSIRATLDRVVVHPAESRRQDPRERIDIVPHDGLARLTGKTPPIPRSVA